MTHLNTAQFSEKTHVTCDNCQQQHPAEYSHEGRWSEGPIYAVVCPKDHLTDYYTAERLEKPAAPRRKR